MKSAQEAVDEAIRNGSAKVMTVNASHLTQAEGGRAGIPDNEELFAVISQSEAIFQQEVIWLAQANGWRVAHFRPVRVLGKNGKTHWETPVAADGKGFLDLVMTNRQRRKLLVIENKVGKNTMTAEQREWYEDFRAIFEECGYTCRVAVWRPEQWKEITACLWGNWPEEQEAAHDERLKAIQKDDGCPHDED